MNHMEMAKGESTKARPKRRRAESTQTASKRPGIGTVQVKVAFLKVFKEVGSVIQFDKTNKGLLEGKKRIVNKNHPSCFRIRYYSLDQTKTGCLLVTNVACNSSNNHWRLPIVIKFMFESKLNILSSF